MKKAKFITGLLVTVLLTLGLVLPAAAQVVPLVVEADLKPGESMTVIKEVTTPDYPPNPDIYFLCDTTASMGPVIAAVQANADTILATIQASQPGAMFGVGNYRDYPGTVPPFTNQLAMTGDASAVSTAIGVWAAGGGGDWPEGQFYALDRLADGTDIDWRTGPNKIVVWLGDAPAHDPVPNAATGLGYDITEATVTAALVAAGIKVIAISWDSGDPSPYRFGLDDNPNVAGGDYATAYSIVEDGSAGQASRIATTTGGAYLFAATPEKAAAAVLAGIEQLTTDVWWEVEAQTTGLTVTLAPEVYYDVSGGTMVQFLETITVADDAPQCETIRAVVVFYANSYEEGVGEVIGRQEISIHVLDITPPEVDAGPDVTVEQTSYEGAPAQLQPEVTDNCDPNPTVVITGAMDIYPLGDTTVTVTATDASGNTASDSLVVHVVDTTPPNVTCVETVNPHGNNVPGEKRSDNAKSKAKNPDGFYELCVTDICDPEPKIYVSYIGADPYLFGPFMSGDVVKVTEAPGAAPSMKKIGSSNGEAGAVAAHITLPSDPVVYAVDASGNVSTCICFVPPPPK